MLLLICGVGRSGKTTFSAKYRNVVHLDLMSHLSNRYNAVNDIVRNESDVVVEGIYNRKEYRTELLKAYKGKDRKCVWINTPKSIVLERMAKDGISVTQEHFYFEPPTYSEVWDEIIVIGENE